MKLQFLSVTALLCAAGMASALEFGNDHLKMNFADAPAKGGLLGITDVKNGVEVLKAKVYNQDPILWELRLSKVGSGEVTLTLTNRDAGKVAMHKVSNTRLEIVWSQIAKEGVTDAATVKLTVDLRPDGASVWNLVPELKLSDYTFESMVFPYAEKVVDPKKERLLFPTGNVGSRMLNGKQNLVGIYPSYNAQVQFFGIYGRAKAGKVQKQGGIYIGLEDSNAVRKRFEILQDTLKVFTYAEDTSVAGKSRIPAYPVVIAASPDPWHSSKLYRQWATKQIWCSRGRVTDYIKAHPGYPNPHDIELWLQPQTDHRPSWFDEKRRVVNVAKCCLKERELLPDVKMALHWYHWSVHRMDHNYPNFFPLREDTAEAGKMLQDAQIQLCPYINGRLWDTANPDYEAVKNEGVMKADGSRVVENYYGGKPGSADLAAMCPSQPSLRAKLAYAVDRLIAELKINAVYIDQIASMTPLACYDPSHGHPLNGGGWWQQEYRKMLQPIVAKHRGHLPIASENGAEPYMDTIDVFFLWGFAFVDDFPSLMAVYNPETTFGHSIVQWDDTFMAFVNLISRQHLMWNIQPGQIQWIYGAYNADFEKQKPKRDYLKRIFKMRRLARPVMENGLPVGDVAFDPQPEKVEVTYLQSTWNRQTDPPKPGKTRPVYGVWWQSDDGKTLLAPIANITDQTYTVNLVTAGELFAGKAGHDVVKIAEDGMRTVIGKAGDKITLEVAPEALFFVEIQ